MRNLSEFNRWTNTLTFSMQNHFLSSPKWKLSMFPQESRLAKPSPKKRLFWIHPNEKIIGVHPLNEHCNLFHSKGLQIFTEVETIWPSSWDWTRQTPPEERNSWIHSYEKTAEIHPVSKRKNLLHEKAFLISTEMKTVHASHKSTSAKPSPKKKLLGYAPKRKSVSLLVSNHLNILHELTSLTFTEMKIIKASSRERIRIAFPERKTDWIHSNENIPLFTRE